MHVNGYGLSRPLVQRRLFLTPAKRADFGLPPLPGQSNKKGVVFVAMLHLRLLYVYVCARSRTSRGGVSDDRADAAGSVPMTVVRYRAQITVWPRHCMPATSTRPLTSYNISMCMAECQKSIAV